MNILIELDAETCRRLEKVAPAKSRKRSAFIRAAIRRSLWELEEQRTRRAYLEIPDYEPVAFDPRAWEPLPYGGLDPPAVKRGVKVDRSPRARKPSQRRRPGRTRKAGAKKKVRSRASRT